MVDLFLLEAESQKFTVLDRSFTATYLFPPSNKGI